METNLNSKSNADVLPSASHDHNTMLVAGEFVPMLSKEQLLKNFMKEFFPFSEMRKMGLFTKEMKNDYKEQSERVCKFLGLKSIYEYGAEEMSAHLSYANGKRPVGEPFVTVFPSIYE